MNYFFGKEGKPSQQMLTLVLAFIICAIVGMGVTMLMTPWATKSANGLLLANSVGQLIMFMAPALWVALRYYQEPRRFLQIQHDKRTGRHLLWGLLLMVLVIPLNECLTSWNDSWHWSGVWSTLESALRELTERSNELIGGALEKATVGQLLINLLAIALVPAVCEELFFRGAIQQIIYRWTHRPHLSIVLTAAIFSLAHMDPFAFLPRFLLGILLGYMFYFSQSIWVDIAAHFLNNAIIVVLYFLYQKGMLTINIAEDMSFAWYIVLASAIVTAAVFYFAWLRKRKTEVEITEIW